MRRRILLSVCMAVCGAMPLVAQAAHPPGPAPAAVPKRRSQATTPRTASPPASQLIFDAASLGSPLLLDKDWRVGITGDPAAATPNFDDSAWEVRDAKTLKEPVKEEGTSSVEEKQKTGVHVEVGLPEDRQGRYAWYRLHIKLAPDHGPLALLIELPVSLSTTLGLGITGLNPDVYANGRLIQPEGPRASALEHYQQISRLYDLNLAPSETSLTLAVRTLYIPPSYGGYASFFGSRSLLLGNRTDLVRELNLWSNRSLFERLPRLVYSLLRVVLAIFLFALYFAQKGHIEYLWLALHELAQAPIAFIELAGSSARLDTLWYEALVLQLVLISAYLFFEFLIAFLSLPRRWYIKWLRYTAPLLAAVGPTLLFVGQSEAIGILLVCVLLCCALWMLGWSLFIFITLIAATIRRNFEAGLLLIPLVFSLVGIIEPALASALSEESGKAAQLPLTLMAGPIPIHFASIGDFTGILVIVLIIFGRFLRVQREQQRATSELEAARSVQELLIPREKPATPGFEVESIYSPANEVGGDFFHVQSAGRDGTLVVIGDVAGKGLHAAMNVSLLMGALRRTSQLNPAAILHSLNRVLQGTGSFTTCQAVWFAANGEMVIANAGHLPPYLNSQEIALPGSLPLGVLPEVTYEEARFYLHPGDRVLLLSDGVVEARQPSGELFGFDRVRNFSQQSAFYLAEAAKAFGQQDDITVLTVRRLVEAAA